MRLLSALLLIFVAAGCDSLDGADRLGESRWTLASGAEAKGARIQFDGSGFVAHPVCNAVFGTYRAGRSRIVITPQGSTRAHCGAGAAAEDAFIIALEHVSLYRVGGDQLTLVGKSVRLVFERE